MSQKKTILVFGVTILSVMVFFSCSNDLPDQNKDVVLKINNFEMTREEFQVKSKADLEYKDQYKSDINVKKKMVEGLIRKELLIQEAKLLGLDRDDQFIEAIERYWEATLIKQLMEQKSQSIQESMNVSEHEIRKRYDTYKKQNSQIPKIDKVETELSNEILIEKTEKALENWVQSLKQKASIHIDETILKE